MKLAYIREDKLPALAWLADIKDGRAKVIHGRDVETQDEFFVEGAWNQPFSAGNFLEADWFCGTGGALRKNSIIFSTPSHVTCGLFSSKIQGGGYGYQTVCISCAPIAGIASIRSI